ncbi:MAG: serine acetyltransferase, partial [Bacteroidetes bacterium]|nr:serine acetyltransferase [Bacteroidota bacterium]
MSEEKFIGDLFQRNRKHFSRMPDKATTEAFINDLFNFLFSSYEGKYETEKKVAQHLTVLKNTFSAIVYDLVRNDEKVNAHVESFFGRLPFIYQQLLNDAEAILKFDPAAQSIEEVLAAYPGFFATAIYRIAHQLQVQGIRTLPRFFSEYAHSRTGIDIHPGAQIGESFFIDHGTGIVIGETAIIGNNVKIYQGVTLGALTVSKANASSRRHPTIENNVI